MKRPPFNILIDLDRLKDLNTGLGHVAVEFGKAISKIKIDELKFTFLVPKKFIGYFGNKVDYEICSLKRRYFPSLCKKYDLWYTIHQDSNYYPSTKKTPYVLTINDLNFLGEKSATKGQLRLKRLQKKVDRACAITVISKYTEKMVREHLKVGTIPIHVIYCGVSIKTFEKPSKPDFVPAGDLLFSIGVVQEKKNYLVLVDFMKHLPDYSLVIAGNKNSDYAATVQNRINEFGLQNKIILAGLVSDEDKFWLYSNCKAVLFPSKFEGMGFPPIEAMRFGKPVFASKFSSVPEVNEDKAYYWDSFEPKYMSDFFLENVNKFYKDKDLPEIVRKHSLKYDWNENAKSYIEFFKLFLAI